MLRSSFMLLCQIACWVAFIPLYIMVRWVFPPDYPVMCILVPRWLIVHGISLTDSIFLMLNEEELCLYDLLYCLSHYSLLMFLRSSLLFSFNFHQLLLFYFLEVFFLFHLGSQMSWKVTSWNTYVAAFWRRACVIYLSFTHIPSLNTFSQLGCAREIPTACEFTSY